MLERTVAWLSMGSGSGGWLAFRRLSLFCLQQLSPGCLLPIPGEQHVFSLHTLCSLQRRREGGWPPCPSGASPEGLLWMPRHGRSSAGDPGRQEMAVLSNILAAYSFVSGSCPTLAGPGLRLGAVCVCMCECRGGGGGKRVKALCRKRLCHFSSQPTELGDERSSGLRVKLDIC